MHVRKSSQFVLALSTLSAVLWLFASASACPFCDGGPSGVNEVKAGIFNDMFWLRAVAVLAPFPILLGLVAIIYFWPEHRLSSQGQLQASQQTSQLTEDIADTTDKGLERSSYPRQPLYPRLK